MFLTVLSSVLVQNLTSRATDGCHANSGEHVWYPYYLPTRLRPYVWIEVTVPGFILSPILLPEGSFLLQNVTKG